MADEVKEEKQVSAWQVVLLFEPSFPLVCKFASVQAVNVRLGVPAPVLPGWGDLRDGRDMV